MSIIFIKYSLLNFIFIKQVNLHLKCSVSSTVTKFEHCHYIRCGDTAQYSKISLSGTSAPDE